MYVTAALAENEFLYAGNLMAASILQDGTAPCFLKKSVYDYRIMGPSEELDLSICDIKASEMKNFVEKVHLPKNQVRLCCEKIEGMKFSKFVFHGFSIVLFFRVTLTSSYN